MIDLKAPGFTELSEFCSEQSGGKVLFATDDFFAVCENMIADTNPVFIPNKYTEFGKWMDGWETRRKRVPGHDWCIIKLSTRCLIQGVLVDTAFFTGNYTPKYSIQAANLTPEEEKLIPSRNSEMGTACSKEEIDHIKKLNSEKWEEIIPITVLRPGYEDTRLNYQKVVNDDAWTHIRVNMFPDGGIARLRVFGEAKPDTPPSTQLTDLLSLMNGGLCLAYSNAHFGHPRNMIKPGKSKAMFDGWETARRLDRLNIIEANEDGTMKVTGEEWAIFKLGFSGTIEKICVDTLHFKGNSPDYVRIEGAFINKGEINVESSDITWSSIMPPKKLKANSEHWFACSSDVVSHIKVVMAPDGGISRIRCLGYCNSNYIDENDTQNSIEFP